MRIGTGLSAEEKVQFVRVLIENIDVFAWTPTDMPGIDPEVIVHCLKVDSAARPVKQKPRRINEERSLALRAEVGRLLEAGSIRECHYPEWLANPVLVKKKNGK